MSELNGQVHHLNRQLPCFRKSPGSLVQSFSWTLVRWTSIERHALQVAQRGSAAVRGLGAGLSRSQEEGSERARLWLNDVEEDMRKQAAVSQETLKVGPSPSNTWSHHLIYLRDIGAKYPHPCPDGGSLIHPELLHIIRKLFVLQEWAIWGLCMCRNGQTWCRHLLQE